MDSDINDDDYYMLNYDPVVPITPLERSFQQFEKATAESMAAEEKYKAAINKTNITRSMTNKPNNLISKVRSKRRNALRILQTKAQQLHTKAVADDVPFYADQAYKSMRDSDNKLFELDTAGLRRKRNKSRNKVYSAHKKSKRRRVKSTRRRHKKKPYVTYKHRY